MKVTKLFTTDERAVSPVVGVALLIAIAVILAAVIGAVVLGLGTGGVDTPTAQLQLDHDDDGNLTLVHNGGEPLDENDIVVVVDDDSNHSLNDTLTAGTSVNIVDDDNDPVSADDGDEVVILWEDPQSESESVLERFEV